MYQIISVPIENCTERLTFGLITRKGGELTQSEREFIDDVTARYRKIQAMET